MTARAGAGTPILQRERLDPELIQAFLVSLGAHLLLLALAVSLPQADRRQSVSRPAAYTVGLVSPARGSRLLAIGPLARKASAASPAPQGKPKVVSGPEPKRVPAKSAEGLGKKPAQQAPARAVAKPIAKSQVKRVPKAVVKHAGKVAAKPPPKAAPKAIAARKASSSSHRPAAKPAPKVLPRTSHTKASAKPAARPVERTAAKPTAKPAAKAAIKPAAKVAIKPATRPAAKPATKPATKPAVEKETRPAGRAAAKPKRQTATPALPRAAIHTGQSASGKAAARASALPESARAGAGGATRRGIEFVRYYEWMLARIHTSWVWVGAEGGDLACTVRFSVEPDGQIAHLELVERSGSTRFDQSVLNAVRSIPTLGPPPARYRKDFSEVEITFRPRDRH